MGFGNIPMIGLSSRADARDLGFLTAFEMTPRTGKLAFSTLRHPLFGRKAQPSRSMQWLFAHADLPAERARKQRRTDHQSDNNHGHDRGLFKLRAGGKIEHQQRECARFA